MAITIQAGLRGGDGVYCGGVGETARRQQQIAAYKLQPWKRKGLKSWKSLNAKATRKQREAAAVETPKAPTKKVTKPLTAAQDQQVATLAAALKKPTRVPVATIDGAPKKRASVVSRLVRKIGSKKTVE